MSLVRSIEYESPTCRITCWRLANKYRQTGYKKLSVRNYYAALYSFNNAILCGKKFNVAELLSVGYGARSVVYFEVQRYKECLENIYLARQFLIPVHLRESMDLRERRCREILQHHQEPTYGPKDFFKLSITANVRIPFIANCLELRRDEHGGTGIFLTRDLKAGDIIAIEEPLFNFISFPNTQCANCAKQNMLNLIPGGDDSKSKHLNPHRFTSKTFLFRNVLLR